jgi:hypothetical protein
VLAGLVVLGTVLASVVVARGRFLRQRALADRQLRATEAVDQLISNWTGGGTSFDSVPRAASGALPGVEGCRWRTLERRDPAAIALGARVVRIEVWDRDPDAGGRSPVASLELLVHDRPAAPPATRESGGVAR